MGGPHGIHTMMQKQTPSPMQRLREVSISRPLPSPDRALWLPSAASFLWAPWPPLAWPVCHGNSSKLGGSRNCRRKERGRAMAEKGKSPGQIVPSAGLYTSLRYPLCRWGQSTEVRKLPGKRTPSPCDWAPHALPSSSLPQLLEGGALDHCVTDEGMFWWLGMGRKAPWIHIPAPEKTGKHNLPLHRK